MKITVIPIDAFQRVPKGFERELKKQEIKGRIETIPITAFLITARILRRAMETCGDLPSVKDPSVTLVGKNHKDCNNNNNNNNNPGFSFMKILLLF